MQAKDLNVVEGVFVVQACSNVFTNKGVVGVKTNAQLSKSSNSY